jgi:hypothetical protein
LAKIREARKKQGKDITSNKAVLSAGFFAFCGLIFLINSGINAWKQIELPHAKPYVVYDQSDVFNITIGGSIEFLITANSQDNIANNADQFAQTAMQAVIDLDKNNVNFVRVKLYQADNTKTNTQNYYFLLSSASYDKTKNKWDVMTKERRLTKEETWISKNWYKFRKHFIEDDVVNEAKLRTLLFKGIKKSKVLKKETIDKYTKPEQIHLPWIQNNNYKLTND